MRCLPAPEGAPVAPGAREARGYPSRVRFRAVLFDAGETLVHPSPSFPRLFCDVLAAEGHVREPDDVVRASRAVFERFSEAARDREPWTTSPERSARFWGEVYERMLATLDLPAADGLREALYRTFTDLRNYALFDDVLPALDALGPTGAVLGVVSNYEAWLEDLLTVLGVRERLPIRVISGVVGVEKPDPRIWELALDAAGVGAADAAYVGDNPEFDVWPAAALGMTPVLIDRRQRFPSHEGLRIDDLRDLPRVLETA
jgi:FMN phosphatase YigB (HAD superfamily)